jgi:hypothetical protein
MAILRRCRGNCSNPKRCLEHLWFDVMHGGTRYRMAANEFAIPRMPADRQRPIESLEEARTWERLFIGEIEAGRDPRRPRRTRTNTDVAPRTVAAFLDEPKPGRTGAGWNREQLQRIDLRWHDLRHEGSCRLLADGVDIRIIQLMLGHASIQQTQRYLNVTDEELRRGLEVSWSQQGRPLRLASGG